MTMGDHRSRLFWRSVGGGVLAGLAPAASGPLLMLPALALLWSVADRPKGAALWGGMAVLVSHRWLLGLHPLTWMGVPSLLSLPIAVLIWLICALAAAALVGLWAGLARWLMVWTGALRPGDASLSVVVVLSASWGLAEVVLAGSPLFWLGIGGSVLPLDVPLAGLSRWIGSAGLAAVMLMGGWGFELVLIRRNTSRAAWVWLAGVLLVHGLGAVALHATPEAQGRLSLAAWQTAIPTREKFSPERQRRLATDLRDALDQAEALDVEALVAPEGTLPSGWDRALAGQPLPLLSGGFRRQDGKLLSSLLLLRPGDGGVVPLLDKHRLVPLGEALPPLPAALSGGLSAVGGLEPGPASRLFRGFDPPGAAAICYEISDGGSLATASAAGAQWLLSIANLDPYPIQLQRQFLALAQLRAIESGRDLISVANTGPTALLRADGIAERLLPSGRAGVGRGVVGLRDASTPYARWREFPLLLMLLSGVVGIGLRARATSPRDVNRESN